MQFLFHRLQGCSSSCFCCLSPGGRSCLRGLCRLPGGRDWYLSAGGWSWVLSFWWAGLCHGMCLAGSSVLGKTLSSLSVDGWDCVPALLVVWPEASQHWSLQVIGWGQVLVRKWQPPRGLMPMSTPQNYHRQCPCSHSEPQLPRISTRDPPLLAGNSGSVSYEVIVFSPESWCAQDPVCTLQQWSFCFPPAFGIPVIKPLAFKARPSGRSSFHCLTPRLGSHTWGSKLSLLWENFCGIIIFQFVGCQPSTYGICFYHD